MAATIDLEGFPPPELIAARRLEWLGGEAFIRIYGMPSERDLTLMYAALNYYAAWDAWINSTSKKDIIENNPDIAKLAGEIEFYRLEELKAKEQEADPNGNR